MWHYRGRGLYGEQLTDLLSVGAREQVHVLRYRDLVDQPEVSLARISEFLGVEPLPLKAPAPENVKPFVADTARSRALAQLVRAGAVRVYREDGSEWWRLLSRMDEFIERKQLDRIAREI